MPWEETPDYIRSGHRDPAACQPGTVRTVEISRDAGIRAIICRPEGKDSITVQSYLFAKAKGWTMEKAKQWFQEHQQDSLAGSSITACQRFDFMSPTVGDLVGRRLGVWQELSDARVVCASDSDSDSSCSRLHAALGVRCLGICRWPAAIVNAALAGRSKSIVGDLTGLGWGELPHAEAELRFPTQRLVRNGKVVEIPMVGNLVGVPLRRSK